MKFGRLLIIGVVALSLLAAGLTSLPLRGGGVEPTTAAPAPDAAGTQADAESQAASRARRTALRRPVDAIGERFVAGFSGVTPPASLRQAIRGGRLGGVILFASNVPSVARAKQTVDLLQREAQIAGRPPLLIMVDQEGGVVRRFRNLPPDRSAASLGRSVDVYKFAHMEGTKTGRGLLRAGVNVNLAPVVDVPSRDGSFLGTRAYSRDPQVVATAACAFTSGMQKAGVAGAFKHFPGLGYASANTDDRRVTINATTAQLSREQAAYRRCAGTPHLTMLSSAAYPRAGINEPAVVSKTALGRLRELGFTGVTVSDAMDTPALAPYRRVPERAIAAGTDMLLYVSAAKAEAARKSVVAAWRAGRLKAAQLADGSARIGVLRERVAARR